MTYSIGLCELNVLDYGADATGSADCVSAIMAAYSALPAPGGRLVFPPGRYKVNSALVFSAGKTLSFKGGGLFTTTILRNFTSGDAITFVGDNYDDNFEMCDIGIEDQMTCDINSFALKVDGGINTVKLDSIFFNCTTKCVFLNNCSAIMVESLRGAGLNTALHIFNASFGTVSDCNMRCGDGGSSTSYGEGPCLRIEDSTSIKVSDCNWQGGGPVDKINIRGISSTGTSFTVILDQETSPFDADGYMVIRGATPAAYNGVWKVDNSMDSIGSFAVVTVATTANPGTASVPGKAESISACVQLAAYSGSCNESNLTGNLFEEMNFRGYGSASLFVDGTRSDCRIEGWTIGNNYYDFGENGIILKGKPNAAGEPTVFGFNFAGGECENGTRVALFDQVTGIAFTNFNGPAFGLPGNGKDNLLPSGYSSCGVQIIAGSAEPKARGITIGNCNLGMSREWSPQQWSNYAYDAAMILDGAGIQDVLVSDCQLYGKVEAIHSANSAQAATSRWRFRSCRVAAVSGPTWTAANEIPTIASASSITLPIGYEAFRITGSVTITTMNGGYVDREVVLYMDGAASLGSGSMWARSAAYTTLVGLAPYLRWDGAKWYVR